MKTFQVTEVEKNSRKETDRRLVKAHNARCAARRCAGIFGIGTWNGKTLEVDGFLLTSVLVTN